MAFRIDYPMFFAAVMVVSLSGIYLTNDIWSRSTSATYGNHLMAHYNSGRRHEINLTQIKRAIHYGKPAENILLLTLPRFLPEYKNPCWIELVNNSTKKCLPYFYVAGVAKSGTNDVYRRITSHPHILLNKKDMKGMNKVRDWWTRKRFDRTTGTGEDIPGDTFEGYLSRFPLEKMVKEQTPVIENWYKKYVIGDGSAALFYDNTAWRGLAEEQEGSPPGYDEPKDTQHQAYYIHHLQPKAKIIVIFRNPITRLYSEYNYFVWTKKGKSVENFHTEVVRSTEAFSRCVSRRSLRACVFELDFQIKYETRVAVGLYHVHLLEWYKHFPKEQILVLRLEDPVLSNLRQAYTFLGLDELPRELMEDIVNAKPKNKQKKYAKMFPETWALLDRFYHSHNAALARILNDTKYHWNDTAPLANKISYKQ